MAMISPKYKRRGQGSMEYMMQYGWAVLMIVIVLVILFALFGNGQGSNLFTPPACLPGTDFQCANLAMNTSGYVSMAFAHGGDTWGITRTGCSSTNTGSIVSVTQVNATVLPPGQTATLIFKCPVIPHGASSAPIGTPFSGYLFVMYNTSTQSNVTSEIATINAKVSTSSSFGALGSSGGPPAVPAVSQTVVWNASVGSQSITTSASNELIVIMAEGYPAFTPTATVDGNPATQIATQICTGPCGTDDSIAFLYYRAVSAGPHTIVVSDSGGSCCFVNFALAAKHISTSGITTAQTQSSSPYPASITASIGTTSPDSLIVSSVASVNSCGYTIAWSGSPTTPTKTGELTGYPSTCVQGSAAYELANTVTAYSLTTTLSGGNMYGGMLAVAFPENSLD